MHLSNSADFLRRAPRPDRPSLRPLVALVLTQMVVTAMLLLGCESTPAITELESAQRAYRSGELERSLEHADAAQQRGDVVIRGQAAYTGGLAAYRLGRLDDAERRLRTAASSPHRETSGRARAMLGTIEMDRNRPREAAVHFREAAELLTGDESSRASYEAGMALRAAGDPVGARTQLIIAAGESGGEIRSDAHRELARTGFTVQAGAFRERANADRLVAELRQRTTTNRAWPIRVILDRGRDGQPIHLVQVGEFTTRQAAESARRQLGQLEYRVVSLTR